jgi:probable DNA metabolism protein
LNMRAESLGRPSSMQGRALTNPPIMEARLASQTDIRGFRTEARNLLAHQVHPDSVTWSAADDVGIATVGGALGDDSRPRAAARAASSIVPASFVRLCDYVVQHRDPERFALLYRLLWRLVHEPELRHDAADADMARAQHMAHAVRRDIHKLKTHVRFRAVADPHRPGETLHIAWCEPAHHIVDTVGPWFAKQRAAIRWVLLTPERSAYWDGAKLHYAHGSSPPLASAAQDGDWLARWKALFG